MLIALLYWLLALLCCGHAMVFGGRDGRWAGSLFLGASGLTVPATLLGGAWGDTELLILVVDIIFLASLYVLMLTSRRYWLIWMVGFHLVAVVTHLSTLLSPTFTPELYRAMGSFWAIPILLVLLTGVEMDRRAAGRARLATAASSERTRYES